MKRLSTFLLALAMILTSLTASASAAGDMISVTVEQVTAAAGESVEVPINIANNTGICGAMISISYDSSLTLTDITAGSALSSLNMTKPGNYAANPINIMWDGISENDCSNGSIAVLTFTAPEESGTYQVSASYVSGNVLDADLNAVELDITNGAVVVSSGPVIQTQPADYAGAAGTTAVFTVAASGDSLTYQWQYQLPGSDEWADSTMAGNQTAKLSVGVVTLRDGQKYRCVICDGSGNEVISDAAAITVTDSADNPFVDVSATSYYVKPVLWAYESGVTSGIDATHFGAREECTRGQVVTFLWRAQGCPEPSTTRNPFSDVSTSDYYYKSVLWAYESGITSGVDSTHFAPDDTVTRGQVITFIWRAAGKPTPSTTANPFVDVSTSSYAFQAILWGKENGITAGVDASHFGVASPCTRADVVTFLYRAVEE